MAHAMLLSGTYPNNGCVAIRLDLAAVRQLRLLCEAFAQLQQRLPDLTSLHATTNIASYYQSEPYPCPDEAALESGDLVLLPGDQAAWHYTERFDTEPEEVEVSARGLRFRGFNKYADDSVESENIPCPLLDRLQAMLETNAVTSMVIATCVHGGP